MFSQATLNIGNLFSSAKERTEELVKKIELFNPNTIPPKLEDAEIHRECQSLGQPLEFSSLSSVKHLH